MCCGTDIIEISRIKDSIEKYGDVFLDKIYTKQESAYCEKLGRSKFEHYAARFAVKEAVSKVLGTGFNGEFEWTDIETVKNLEGKPEVLLHNGAKRILTERGFSEVSISISHCKEYAVAMAVGI